MAKPSGSTCNLDCSYCYYLSKERLPRGPGAGEMSDETLEIFVAQYIEAAAGGPVVFSWQGGEPTLRGLAFFRRVVELQRKYGGARQRIENDLQTNGVLLDADWVAFLKENNFLVGLSIDGPRALHDRYRVNKGGAPTFDKVMAAADLLRRSGVPFNTLACVHRANAAKPLDVYRFLRDEVGSTYIQFIPIVQIREFETTAPGRWDVSRLPRIGEPRARPGGVNSIVTDWSVDPDEYGAFLVRIFDEWRARDLGRVLVNHFETLVAQHVGLPSQLCIYSQTCGAGLAVEHNGSVYSCDHYVYPEYELGRIQESSLRTMADSPTQRAFGDAKSALLPDCCKKCPFLGDCWGECPKNRVIRSADGEPGLNYLCAGLKRFYAHAIPHVERIAADIRRVQSK